MNLSLVSCVHPLQLQSYITYRQQERTGLGGVEQQIGCQGQSSCTGGGGDL